MILHFVSRSVWRKSISRMYFEFCSVEWRIMITRHRERPRTRPRASLFSVIVYFISNVRVAACSTRAGYQIAAYILAHIKRICRVWERGRSNFGGRDAPLRSRGQKCQAARRPDGKCQRHQKQKSAEISLCFRPRDVAFRLSNAGNRRTVGFHKCPHRMRNLKRGMKNHYAISREVRRAETTKIRRYCLSFKSNWRRFVVNLSLSLHVEPTVFLVRVRIGKSLAGKRREGKGPNGGDKKWEKEKEMETIIREIEPVTRSKRFSSGP